MIMCLSAYFFAILLLSKRARPAELAPRLHFFQEISRSNKEHGIVEGLPSLDKNGNLPPGIYVTNWENFSFRFGWNSCRKRLLHGLHRQMLVLKTAGCTNVVVGGSLVSSKFWPGDFDGCYDLTGIELALLSATEPGLRNPNLQDSIRKRDGGLLYASVYLPNLELSTLQYLQLDRNDCIRGVVLIRLCHTNR